MLFEPSVIDRYPSRAAWDAEATGLVHSALERWRLTPHEPFTGGEAASVIAVTTEDGEDAVLKLGFPHAEAVGEAIALEAWGTELAPRVLRQDAWTWGLLIDRVRPGTPLSESPLHHADALRVGAELYARLREVTPVTDVPPLRDVVGAWLDNARGALPRLDIEQHAQQLVSDGLDLGGDLVLRDGASVMVHGDFNPGNILATEQSGGWRVIDPKPMLGDPEFDGAPLAAQLGDPWAFHDPEQRLAENVALFVAGMGGDYAATVDWGFVRAALDVVWYLEDADVGATAAAATRLTTWGRLRT